MDPRSAFGNRLKLAVRGASHARKMTFTLENFPAGLAVDAAQVAAFMARRAPGRDRLSTARRESDEVVWRRGFESRGEDAADLVTTGGTIVGEIASRDMRPADYGAERTIPRPGHADFGQWIEMGCIPTGGGKNSGRLTAPLCAAGALCLQWLARRGIRVSAGVASVCGRTRAHEMVDAIERAKKAGDSVGGTIACEVAGLPPALGGPLFDGLESGISAAVFGIPGVKGVFFGDGCTDGQMCRMRASAYNDAFAVAGNGLVGSTLRQGGILGGRTYGMPVRFTVTLRPTPTVFVEQDSVDLATMKPAKLSMKGRHDPCIVRRAVPVVEAVTAFAVMDALLAAEAERSKICLTLTGKTLEEDIEQYRSQRYFTDMVELRVDLLKKGERAKAAKFPAMLAKEATWRVPCLLTFRRTCDGGAFAGEDAARAKFFAKVLSARNAAVRFDYVDFEEGFGDGKLVRLAREAGARVVRSLHRFDGPVKNIGAKLRALAKDGDIAKVAFMPRRASDVDRLFAQLGPSSNPLSGGRAIPHVVCAMGPLGLPTRVLAGRLGSLWTYASVGGLGRIGHLSPYELVRDYRFRSVSNAAKVVYTAPEKVAQTNAAFLAEDEDAVALPNPGRARRKSQVKKVSP